MDIVAGVGQLLAGENPSTKVIGAGMVVIERILAGGRVVRAVGILKTTPAARRGLRRLTSSTQKYGSGAARVARCALSAKLALAELIFYLVVAFQ